MASAIQAFSILNQLVVHEPGLLRLVAPTAFRNGPSMSLPCGWLSPAVTTVNVTPGGTEKPLVPRLAEICCFEVTFQILPIVLFFSRCFIGALNRAPLRHDSTKSIHSQCNDLLTKSTSNVIPSPTGLLYVKIANAGIVLSALFNAYNRPILCFAED